MYAVIRTGGKQYRVSAGDRLRVEKLTAGVGDEVELGEVLMIAPSSDGVSNNDGNVHIGKPFVEGAKVLAKVVGQKRDKKIIVFKFRRRKGYRRKNGHRQPYTELEVLKIHSK